MARRKKRAAKRVAVEIDHAAVVRCRHCGAVGDHWLTNTYRNGNLRYICDACNRPFIALPARKGAMP